MCVCARVPPPHPPCTVPHQLMQKSKSLEVDHVEVVQDFADPDGGGDGFYEADGAGDAPM